MKFKSVVISALLCAFTAFNAQAAANIEYLPQKQLADVFKGAKAKPIKSGTWKVPVITWPGDTATIATI